MQRLKTIFITACLTLFVLPPLRAAFWDSRHVLKLTSDVQVIAGPVWSDQAPTDGRSPPTHYRVSVEKKRGNGWSTLMEKEFTIDEVNWHRLEKANRDDIIKYHQPTNRVAFFLKDQYATVVYNLADTAPIPPPKPATTAAPEESVAENDSPAADLGKAMRFVPSVVFHVQKGTVEYRTKRWTTRPTLVIEGDKHTSALESLARDLDRTIFDAAGPLPGGSGKIIVHLGPAKDIEPIQRKITKLTNQGSWSFWTSWSGDRAITEAHIFLITDRLKPDETGHYLAKAFMGAVGFPDESNEFKESILHPQNQGSALAPIDRRLISFIYRHTEPGIGREPLVKALKAHWR